MDGEDFRLLHVSKKGGYLRIDKARAGSFDEGKGAAISP